MTTAFDVAPANSAQAAAWDGNEGAYWAEHADHFDRAIAAYHRRLLAAAAIGSTDRVIDIGCGSGQTTRDAAKAAAQGSALGVDLSARMLDHARRRAAEEGIANATFVQADAQVFPFDRTAFDVAISRTGAMFFADLTAAFTNVGGALVEGGRLAMIVWQPISANEWLQAIPASLAAGRDLPGTPPDGPGPFSLSKPDRVRDVLSAAGFADIEVEGAEAEMWFGADADDAHRFVLGLMGWMLEGLDDSGRAQAVDELLITMRAHETGDGVVFGSAAWVVTATRH